MANAFINAPGEITARLTDYLLAARWDDLPQAVRHEALRSFVNIMGCTIGGARHEAVALADDALAGFAGAGGGHRDRPAATRRTRCTRA
ncbi:MAG: MmgE/PrpD family protein [Acetobacteraceae bacterium]